MSIPPEIQALVDRLNQELEEIEQEVIEGLNLIRPILTSFPNNVILTRFFASLNNTLLFVEISKRRIQITVNRIVSSGTTDNDILEVGEDLGMELGRVIEAKISVRQIVERLRGLQ
jgi:hypothetical protein